MTKLVRIFLIKTRLEAWAVIYALALGACSRGVRYLDIYPGFGGWLMFAACTAAVFMAGAKLLDATRPPAHRRNSVARVVARARAG
jgi:hypothetical protein